MLSIGAAVLGAGYVCGVDIDDDALAIAATNVEEMEVDIDFVRSDITRLALPLARQAAGAAVTAAAEDGAQEGPSQHAADAQSGSEGESEGESAGESAGRDAGAGDEPADATTRGAADRGAGGARWDTVLMNPPFGTRCKGVDMLFLCTVTALDPLRD